MHKYDTSFLSVILVFFSFFAQAQQGCTDMQALNYDADAVENNGSCIYPMTNYTPTLLTNLEGDLSEASGLAFVGDDLWVHNDGGNPDEIYRLDSLTGKIEQELDIKSADNDDWEDIAQSEDYIYIGDFGNNDGNRTNLKIYRFSKNDLDEEETDAEKIKFTYEDQLEFVENHNNNNFDCEAFFFHNDSLHLFTKNWLDNTTKYYVLPADLGEHQAQLRARFNTEGLITGADIAPDGTVVLVGYTQVGATFMWLLYDYQASNFFSGNKRRIELGSAIVNSQMESVTFKKNGYGYIASESFSVLPPKLLAFDSGQWTNPITSSTEILAFAEKIKLYPNPTQTELLVQFEHPISGQYQVTIYNALGQAVLEAQKTLWGEKEFPLENLQDLPNGKYWLQIVSDKKATTLPFQKY